MLHFQGNNIKQKLEKGYDQPLSIFAEFPITILIEPSFEQT